MLPKLISEAVRNTKVTDLQEQLGTTLPLTLVTPLTMLIDVTPADATLQYVMIQNGLDITHCCVRGGWIVSCSIDGVRHAQHYGDSGGCCTLLWRTASVLHETQTPHSLSSGELSDDDHGG